MLIANRNTYGPGLIPVLAALLLTICVGTAPGQEVEFDSMLMARNFTCLLEQGTTVLGGIDGGGVVMWDRDHPATHARLYAGEDLSGNFITDMAWSGKYVWIASSDGGLTRVSDPGPHAEYRSYTSNLGSMRVTAVTGAVIGSSEWVYYGMNDGGLGRIVDGISGNIYTADQDGLIDDNVNALQFFNGDLFAGTPVGISRFANNVFTDQNTGLGNTSINVLTLDSDGNLLAGTDAGVFIWDPDAETWSPLGTLTLPIHHINPRGGELWALAGQGNGNGVLLRRVAGVWVSLDLPFPKCDAMYAGTEVWVGGTNRLDGMDGSNGLAWYGRMDTDDVFSTWQMDASVVVNAEGVTYGTDGRGWIGSRLGRSISARETDVWTSVYEVATVDNDSTGLFNHYAPILAQAAGIDGSIFVGQYSSGIVKYDPVTGATDHITRWNSGLNGHAVVNLLVHPDGPLIVMHDWADPNNVEVLTEPDQWGNPSLWITLPQGAGGLGNGPGVWDAVVERRDVIWFAVEEGGLVRWDINGDEAGPDDPLTWLDPSDDRWDEPIADFRGTLNDPAQTVALALGPDRLLWAGGNGLTRFSYDAVRREAEVEDAWQEKTSNFEEGLVNGTVRDLAVDAHGDVWVATWTGLNRVRVRDQEKTIDAWLDMGNYFANPDYGLLYSSNVLANLSGGNYAKLVADGPGRRLLLSSDRGATEISVGDLPAAAADPLSSLFLYPNPFHPAEGAGELNLGGVTIDRLHDTPATVEIFNLDGQLVYRYSYANSEQGFWNGLNRVGNPVVTGMYVVKVQWQGFLAIRPLAVVR